MKVFVTGGGGLVGSELVPALRARGHEVLAPSRAEVDVTRPRRVREAISDAGASCVVNLAAYTDVDRAESDEEAAFLVNRDAAGVVAQTAAEAGAILLHMSTDYVFDGTADRPYLPDARRRPLNVYGRSKSEGEDRVRAAGGLPLIVRTSWLYGAGRRDFLDDIRERAERGAPLPVVHDQRGTPTWTRSLAESLMDLLGRSDAWPAEGVLHLADEGSASWVELAATALRLWGMEADLNQVSSAERRGPAPRPGYSVLDLSAARELLGRPIPHWTRSLERYLGGPREPR